VILTGIGLPDDGLHSPNEKLDLSQLWSGIEIFGRFFELFAEKAGKKTSDVRRSRKTATR
jgi:amidohydrolase